VVEAQETIQAAARCTLCPAGCELALAREGAQIWRTEYPLTDSAGLCPRGAALGELLGHHRRIVEPARRSDGQLQRIDMPSALREILDAASDGLTIMLGANIPCQQLAAAAHWCENWQGVKLCFVIEPADEQLLLGTEAGGAKYLGDDELSDCDGFLIIGDAFAANPICARGVFDRRKAEPRTPIVVIDPAAGTAAKFATHKVDIPPGMEFAALSAVASPGQGTADWMTAAAAAAKAIAGCKRLAILIAAEYGRTDAWRQIGFAAGKLAASHGGGVAPQTVGANALAAVRLAAKFHTISLAKAMSSPGLRIAVGCDVAGMLGYDGSRANIFAAAAPLPNRTTDSTRIVLPVAMECEMGGTYLLAGGRQCEVSPLLAPPAAVPSPAELVAALAGAAGVAKPDISSSVPLERAAVDPPVASRAASDKPGPVLLFTRQATHAGCGELTGWGSWQISEGALPQLSISPADAREMKLKNLSTVTVRTEGDGKSHPVEIQARLRVAPELRPGVMVISEGWARARTLNPCTMDTESGAAAAPVTVSVSC